MPGNAEIVGMDKLIWCLNKLPDKTSYRILITALKRAGKPIQKRAKQLVPKRTRNLMKSISVFPSKSKSFPVVWIGPVSGKRKKADGWYAHFIHFGTKGFGKRTRSGKTTLGYGRKGGGLKAIPFMTDAFNQKKNEAFGIIHSELKKSIVKFLQKNIPKK